jgi:4-phospho-D-threonate 3-dehydrogenase / 4-phospho-D-erythronate 3-dehydrogenase
MVPITPPIGITLGDVTGIGPEVVLKSLAVESHDTRARYLLIGDEAIVQALNLQLGLDLDLVSFDGPDTPGRFVIHQPGDAPLPAHLRQGAPEAALAALAWLRDGAARCQRGELSALVTAPVNKEAILRAGQPFIGQTEYLSQLAGTSRTAMMLVGDDDQGRPLRVILATTHLPLRQVPDALTIDGILLAIELAAEACRELGLPRARIGVCGLNPHAGEGGLLGSEEQTLIAPAIASARARGLEASGPHAADTLLHQAYRGDYEVVVAMYHDQGLAPLKLIAFDRGVNWTVGLPFIRTSPDHGTAYDLAGRGTANPASFRAALRLARQLAESRTLPGAGCQTLH